MPISVDTNGAFIFESFFESLTMDMPIDSQLIGRITVSSENSKKPIEEYQKASIEFIKAFKLHFVDALNRMNIHEKRAFYNKIYEDVTDEYRFFAKRHMLLNMAIEHHCKPNHKNYSSIIEKYKNKTGYYFNINIDEHIDLLEFEKEYSAYEYYAFVCAEIKDYIHKIFIEKKKQQKKLEFADLFNSPHNTDEKIDQLKTILKTKNYISEQGIWKGLTPRKNELATLYHYFRDISIIRPGTIRLQLIAFYREFGLFVAKEQGEDIYTTCKNIENEPGFTDTYTNFETALSEWIE